MTDDVPSASAGPGRIIKRQTTYWDLHPSGRALLRAHFTKKLETRFESEVYDNIVAADEHPLLDDYRETWASLYVVNAQRCGPKLIEDLTVAVERATGGWRAAQEYLDRDDELLADARRRVRGDDDGTQ